MKAMKPLVILRHIPRSDWPSKHHRSLAQVARTEALLAKRQAGKLLLNIELQELGLLLDKAQSNNPPEDEKAGAA